MPATSLADADLLPMVTPWKSETLRPMTASQLTTRPHPWSMESPSAMTVSHGRSIPARFWKRLWSMRKGRRRSGRRGLGSEAASWHERKVNIGLKVRIQRSARIRSGKLNRPKQRTRSALTAAQKGAKGFRAILPLRGIPGSGSPEMPVMKKTLNAVLPAISAWCWNGDMAHGAAMARCQPEGTASSPSPARLRRIGLDNIQLACAAEVRADIKTRRTVVNLFDKPSRQVEDAQRCCAGRRGADGAGRRCKTLPAGAPGLEGEG